MRKRIAAVLVAAMAVVVLVVPVQAKPIVDFVPSQKAQRSAELDRAYPAYRLRLAPKGTAETRKARLKRGPTAEHLPAKPHWSTSQAYI